LEDLTTLGVSTTTDEDAAVSWLAGTAAIDELSAAGQRVVVAVTNSVTMRVVLTLELDSFDADSTTACVAAFAVVVAATAVEVGLSSPMIPTASEVAAESTA
jgi:CheY-specific phosphatase CheX